MRLVQVSAEDTRGARAVAGLLGNDEYAKEAAQVRGLPPHTDLNHGEIVDFLYRLGIESVGGRKKIFSIEDVGELAWNAHELFNMGLTVSENWPMAFYDALDAMAARITRSGPQRVAVLAVVKWLDGLQDGHGSTIREAAEVYRKRRLPRVRSLTAKQVRSPATESQESKKYGVIPDGSSGGYTNAR